MEVVHSHCAGLDVHKKTVTSALQVPEPKKGWYQETRTFDTMTADLLQLSDWLMQHGVTHVAMESTRRILETGLQHPGAQLRGHPGQRPAHQSGPRS